MLLYLYYIYIYIYMWNAYSFDLLSSNNFSKWIKFIYEGNMCRWLYIYSWLYMSMLWWCRTQISAEQKVLKRYCKSTRITNINWLFIAVGMHYVQKEMNKGKLELTSEMWMFFTFQQGLAPSWQQVGCQFLCQPIGRGSKVMLVFLEEKRKAAITHFSLICKFSDRIQNCPI